MIPILREADTDRAKIFAREDPVDSVAEPVRAILADVKANGDAALKKYTQEFDGVEIATVEVGAGALEEGFRAADPTLVDILYRAAERIAAGMPAAQIAQEVQELTHRCHASFVIDTLEFLYKGGRCSALAMLGANLLQLKPCIEVNNADGSMDVGKKYRGSLDKALAQYVKDKLEGRTDLKTDRVFITHSGISQERIDMVKKLVQQYADFKEIYITRAGCTISSHCGPNTLGVLFMTNT